MNLSSKRKVKWIKRGRITESAYCIGISSLSKAEQKDYDRLKSKLSDVDKDISTIKHKKENEKVSYSHFGLTINTLCMEQAGHDTLKDLEKHKKGIVEEMKKVHKEWSLSALVNIERM